MASEAVLHQSKTAAEPTFHRFAEPSKFLPVVFVFSIIAGLWSVYIFCHCLSQPYERGRCHFAVFNLFTVLLLTCYFRCVFQHPGTIPEVKSSEEGEVNWEYAPQDGRAPRKNSAGSELNQQEKKRMGDRRHCKWCNKYKPDRCHHCRVCRMCVLKMDHHCPWIYNCVGFKNFKYFFLLVLYAAVASHIVVWTMLETAIQAVRDPTTPFMRMFVILFGETIAAVMGFLLTSFLIFHIYLMCKAMTTIEFCEKSRRPNYKAESYSLGLLGNIKAVLGDNVLLWPLPLSPPSGDGVTYGRDQEKDRILLSKDMDAHLVDRDNLCKAQERFTYSTMGLGKPAGTGETPTLSGDDEGIYATMEDGGRDSSRPCRGA